MSYCLKFVKNLGILFRESADIREYQEILLLFEFLFVEKKIEMGV